MERTIATRSTAVVRKTMNEELLRIVDGLARDRNINAETVFEDLEAAMLSAIRKANADTEDDDAEFEADAPKCAGSHW